MTVANIAYSFEMLFVYFVFVVIEHNNLLETGYPDLKGYYAGGGGRIRQLTSVALYRVFRKNCVFFHISLQPLPRLYHCKRLTKLPTQCECTVTPIGW